ncbi:MAG: S-adenosylmethionine:tRNA ribosyltransferase-isomerase [Rickettsiales bacterium]|jgi:S-adenosylmethionine:tRNA ribosyltransferase-isomerase|nr:S-adenosylmethionine:tRNA ribosyltransferase-isomerase [Rickettsiales bacterium]
MKVSLFDFDLPEEFIASEPLEKRDEAKLLTVPELDILKVKDLVDILPSNSLIVLNNTKVIPARLHGVCNGHPYVATLHKNLAAAGEAQGNSSRWLAFIKGSKKLRIGDGISFHSTVILDSEKLRKEHSNRNSKREEKPYGDLDSYHCGNDGTGAYRDLSATVTAKHGEAGVELEFGKTGAEFFDALGRIGAMPLPPYIKREANSEDEKNYQTVYAKLPGAVAAPTAGLHFTAELMDALNAKGIEFAYLTLHVGAGTFKPVTAEDTDGHVMHSEYGIISTEAAAAINRAKRAGRPIVAVGTTTLRLLETAAIINENSPDKPKNFPLENRSEFSPRMSPKIHESRFIKEDDIITPFAGETDIFITPGYKFRTADYLMTNFHLPRSTLFMLVCAFAGTEEMKRAYEFAKKNDFRFYSYGDASLLKRKSN